MSDPTERPAEEAGRGEHDELGYRNMDEERAYEEAGETGPAGEDPAAAEDENRP